MGLPLCSGCPSFGPLSLQFNRVAEVNGCNKLGQGKRKITGTWWPSNRISYSVAVRVPAVLKGTEDPKRFLEERVEMLVLNQQRLLADVELKRDRPLDFTLAQSHGNYIPKSDIFDVAYDLCRELFVKERDPFGIAWGRRLDELVDGVNSSYTTDEVLDRREQSTLDAFDGRPWDIYDVALSDTVSRFPIDFLLFKDMIEGTRLDMTKKRFDNFDELFLYKYYGGATILLVFMQMIGNSPESKASLQSVYHGGIILGVGLGMIDSLRDIGIDARMGRIYLPQDELPAAGLSDDDIFVGKVTEKWKKFMKGQIKRARALLDEGASLVIPEMNVDARLALWTSTLLYREELNVIEANNYDTFTTTIIIEDDS